MSSVSLKSRLVWQCRRGMLELDVILIPFLEQHFDSIDDQQQQLFCELLTQDDPDLYSWLMGYEVSERNDFNQLIAIIKSKIGINR